MASLLSRAVRNSRAMMRSATAEWGDSSIPPNSSSFAAALGGTGEAAALGIGTVLACQKALFDDMRQLPFLAYSGDRLGEHEPLRVQPLIVSEPFGPDEDPGVGFGQLVVSGAMRGNAFLFHVARDSGGAVTQVLVLHPDTVRVWRDKRGKYYTVMGEDYGPDKITHMMGLTLPGSDVAVDVLTYQRLTYQLAYKVNQYAEGFFAGGATLGGVISVPGSGTRAKAREIRDGFESMHSGVVNAHRPGVMFGGATWTQMSVAPENAQFLQTRRYLREEICGLYGVPLQRIQAIVENASQGGGKGLDAIDAGYVKHGLMPAGAPIEWAWSRMLPGGQESWTQFSYDEFLRASAEIQAMMAVQYRTAAVKTINEIRAERHMPPIDGGDDLFAPLNSNSTATGGADNTPQPGGNLA